MDITLSTCAVLIFLAAGAIDLRERRIPNALSVALAGLGLARIGIGLASGGGAVGPALDLMAAAAVFALGAIAFNFRVLGGGDVKLLAAGVLWTGAHALAFNLTVTVLAGGVLALIVIGWNLALAGRGPRARTGSLPYGIAIACGGIAATLLGA